MSRKHARSLEAPLIRDIVMIARTPIRFRCTLDLSQPGWIIVKTRNPERIGFDARPFLQWVV